MGNAPCPCDLSVSLCVTPQLLPSTKYSFYHFVRSGPGAIAIGLRAKESVGNVQAQLFSRERETVFVASTIAAEQSRGAVTRPRHHFR